MMNYKKLSLPLLSLIPVLSLANITATAPMQNLTPAAQTAVGPNAIAVVTKKQVFVDPINHTTINIQYPQLTMVNANAARFNQLINQYINQAIQNFKTNLTPASKMPKNTGIKLTNDSNTLYITYKLANNSNNLLSILFNTSTSYILNAHPSSIIVSYNYDLQTGHLLQLSDLFVPNSNYLQVLSDYCTNALKNMPAVVNYSDPQWIQTGAAATDKNYSVWNIQPQGLAITFVDYQVAAYVAGPQTVVVPYSQLKDVLNPQSVLGRF